MWDAILAILLCNYNWWIHFEYMALSGFPLTFVVFFIMWTWRLFPESMYTSFEINFVQVFLMLCVTDVLQTICHHGAHTYLRHTWFGKSHLIHHTNRHPTPQDAFYTGFLDASFQLILPIGIVLNSFQPSRYTAILFGCVYSWLLLFIHSDPNKEYKWLNKIGLVTPQYHHKHHQNPMTNFNNIFRVL